MKNNITSISPVVDKIMELNETIRHQELAIVELQIKLEKARKQCLEASLREQIGFGEGYLKGRESTMDFADVSRPIKYLIDRDYENFRKIPTLSVVV